jgi:hypothetical protein
MLLRSSMEAAILQYYLRVTIILLTHNLSLNFPTVMGTPVSIVDEEWQHSAARTASMGTVDSQVSWLDTVAEARQA